MSRLFLTSIDLNGNQLLGAVIEVLASAPAHAAGRVYFDSTLDALRVSDGTNWTTLGEPGEPSSDATTLEGESGSYYLDRANHTGSQSQSTITDLTTDLAAKAPLANPTFTGTVSGITKAMVGLSNVDNTADTAKPVSTAQQTALDLKANLVSPALTGTPTAPTASSGTNTTQIATTAFVASAVAALVDTAPGTLDTLNELAAALGDDPNFASTLSGQIGALDSRLDVVEANATGLTHKYATSIGDGSATSYTVTHNLGSRDVQVSVYQVATPYAQVYTDVEAATTNTVTIRFATAPTSNQYRVVVVG